MNLKNVSLYLFAVIIIAIAAEASYFYPMLPQYIASHFDIHGNPDSFSDKSSFFLLETFIVFIMASIFFLIVFFIRKIPTVLLNLPNKDYWLTAERKEETYKIFISYLFWFADITLLLLYYIFRKIYIVNLSGEKGLGGSFFYVLPVYIAATGIVGYLFIKQFMKPTDD